MEPGKETAAAGDGDARAVRSGALLGGAVCFGTFVLVTFFGLEALSRSDLPLEQGTWVLMVLVLSAPALGSAVGAWRARRLCASARDVVVAGVLGPVVVIAVMSLVAGMLWGGAVQGFVSVAVTAGVSTGVAALLARTAPRG